MNDLTAVILAGGVGKRFKSEKSKVLHKLLGIELVGWVKRTVEKSGIKEIIVVASPKTMDGIKSIFKDYKVVLQEIPNGTGGAVKESLNEISLPYTIVLAGDVPGISSSTIENLYSFHKGNNCDITVLSMVPENPYGYGRIVEENGRVVKIVEEKDANEEEKKIKVVNTGIYIFKSDILKKYVPDLKNNNAQGEYYLTDVIGMCVNNGGIVKHTVIKDANEVAGINDRKQLSDVEMRFQREIVKHWQINGVTIHNPQTVYIEADVKIENDVEIYPSVSLLGKTIIKKGSVIYGGITIKDSVVEENSIVKKSLWGDDEKDR